MCGHELDAVVAHARHEARRRGAPRAGRRGPRSGAGTHHCSSWDGSVHARQTTARGARMTRCRVRSRSGFTAAPSVVSVTNCSRRSVRSSQMRRCSASQSSTRASRSPVEHARADPAGLRGADQPVRLEGPHVLHERRERHRELAGELADARRGLAEPSDHGTAGRVRERDEHAVQLLRILSHLAKCCSGRNLAQGLSVACGCRSDRQGPGSRDVTVEVGVIGFKRRPGRLVAATLTVAAMALAGCADSGNAPPPPVPGQADTSGYDQIIAGSPVADAASIPAGSWADKIKQRGKLIRGGTDSGPAVLASRTRPPARSPASTPGWPRCWRTTSPARPDDDAVELVVTTVDTRETLIQNGTVDAVFATYTITPPRAQKVAFAGPVLPAPATAIMVKADDTAINERRRPQRQERWPPRPTRPRCSRCSSSRRRRTCCCSRRTRSASPPCSRAGPTRTCSTRAS